MFRPSLTFTVKTANAMLEAGLDAIMAGQSEIDMADVTAVDSAAVATLLAWQRAAVTRGTVLRFNNLPPNLKSLVELYGVAELLSSASLTSSPASEARADLPHH
jgi:phospholipid transport system transporter-binding protein